MISLFFVFGIISGIGVGCDFTNVDTSGILFSPIWFLYHFLIKKLMVSCCVSSTKIVGPLGPGRSVSSTIIFALGLGRCVSSTKIVGSSGPGRIRTHEYAQFTFWALDGAFRQLKSSRLGALDVAFRQLKSSRLGPWTVRFVN